MIVVSPTLYQPHATTSATGATVHHDDEAWHLLLSPSDGPDPAIFTSKSSCPLPSYFFPLNAATEQQACLAVLVPSGVWDVTILQGS
jgi:hypothetical protein